MRNTRALLVLQVIVAVSALFSVNDAFCESLENKALIDKMARVVGSLSVEDPVFAEPKAAASLLAAEADVLAEHQVPASQVPEKVVKRARKWIGLTIRSEWLPSDLDSRLVPLRNFEKWEKLDEDGIVFSRCVADYLIAEYEIRGYRVVLMEDGVRLSLLIELPVAEDVANAPRPRIPRSDHF